MKTSYFKIFMISLLVITGTIINTSAIAQFGDSIAGKIAGEQLARANAKGNLWFMIGCIGGGCYGIGGIAAIIFAYVYEPPVPLYMLIGKSPEYVTAFSEAYTKTAKDIQVKKVWGGCLTSVVVLAVLILSMSS